MGIMDDYSRLVEIVYVDRLDLDQEWQASGFPPGRADLATTTHITLRGRSTDRWVRRHPAPFDTDRRLVWRSVAGGTPAPSLIAATLADALRIFSTGVPAP